MRERTPGQHIVRLLKGAVAAALVAGVCLWAIVNSGGVLAGQRQSIRFWCGFTGPDGVTMLRIIKGFNEKFDNSYVTMQRMEWATYYNKLLVAGLGERAPEVFVLHVTSIPRFRDAGLLEPLDDMFAEGGQLDRADFDDNIFNLVQHDGKILGVPLDVHPMGLYYNPDLFRKVGLASPDGTVTPRRTREEFMNVLQHWKDNVTDGTFAFAYGNLEYDSYDFLAQWGGPLFNEDFTKSTLNHPLNVEAMQFAADLIHKYKLVPPLERRVSWIGYRQGKVAMAFEGVYMLGDLKRLDNLNYKGATLPQLGPQRGTYGSSHVLCVRAGLEGEERQAAVNLIKHLSDNSLDWAEAGQIPVRKSLRETERFKSMEIQNAFAEDIPNIMFRPMVPFDFEFQSEFQFASEKILYGRETPQVALTKATERMNAVIERYNKMEKYLPK